jgi:hypothetical protein
MLGFSSSVVKAGPGWTCQERTNSARRRRVAGIAGRGASNRYSYTTCIVHGRELFPFRPFDTLI